MGTTREALVLFLHCFAFLRVSSHVRLCYVHSLLDVGSVNEGQVYRLGHIRRGEHQDVVSLSKIVDLIRQNGRGPERRESRERAEMMSHIRVLRQQHEGGRGNVGGRGQR